MKLPPMPHRWDVTPRRAMDIQRGLAAQIRLTPPALPPRLVVGLDAAFTPDGLWCVAAVVLWDAESGATLEERTALRRLRFPYVPGLLSFREAPALLAALRKLCRAPDALLCDGQGLAHPRGLGIACHVGLLAGLPAVGCAKSVLIGQYEEPASSAGSRTPLMWRGAQVGAAIRTRDRVRPVFVSPGHLMDQAASEDMVLRCCRGFRLPEPTRLADQLAGVAAKAACRRIAAAE